MRVLGVGVGVLLLIGGVAPASGQPVESSTPEALVRSLYAHHRPGKKVALDLCNRKTLAQYFDARLTELLLKDCACAKRTGGVCALDWDPFYDAQDVDESDAAPRIKPLTVKPAMTLAVTITNYKPVTLTYEFSKAPDGWRIANIRSAANKWSLRDVLGKTR